MKCKEIQYMIPDYVKNKLPQIDRTFIDQHLHSCSECQNEMDAFRALFAKVAQDIPWKPENSYWGTMIPRIHERLERKPRALFPPWAVKFLMPAASIALLLMFTIEYLPLNLVTGQSAETVLQQVETDDLIEYVEQHSVVGTVDPSTWTGEKVLTADDATVLKTLLRGEQQAYSYVTMDQESINDMVNEQDIDDLMPMLEKSNSISRN